MTVEEAMALKPGDLIYCVDKEDGPPEVLEYALVKIREKWRDRKLVVRIWGHRKCGREVNDRYGDHDAFERTPEAAVLAYVRYCEAGLKAAEQSCRDAWLALDEAKALQK